MIEVYKIMTAKDKIDREQFFPLADSNYGLRGHSLKIRKDRSKLDIRKTLLQPTSGQRME